MPIYDKLIPYRIRLWLGHIMDVNRHDQDQWCAARPAIADAARMF